jgi:hypothetical protein
LFLSNPDASWKSAAMKCESTEVKPFTKIPRSAGKPLEELLLMLTQFEEACKTLEISQKSALRRLQDILKGLEELGTLFNGFSLEYAELATTLDSLGEIYDGNAAGFGDIVMNQQITCEIIYEFAQYISAIRRAAKNIAARIMQWETVTDSLSQLQSDKLQPGPDKIIEDLEEAEQILAKKVLAEKSAFWEQLVIWLQRLTTTWNTLLLRVTESEKYYIQRGFALWKDTDIANH